MIKRLLRSSVVKYAVVGVLGTTLHFGLLLALVEWAGMHPVAGSVTGFIAVLIVSYLLNRHWTFGELNNGEARRGVFIRYGIVSGFGLLLNTVIMTATVSWLHLPYLIGQILVTLIIPIHNYLFNRYWTFQYSAPSSESHS
ncbi:hypothetical protein SY83_03370 [Paenibacillus swuensis]|uniref:GtrA/DPMS transmembrane domain-containing protein n=1 Tax=Paenibacillus swuensis TaxID=1178515 RepID=A0A172TEY0_9BACL|nr:GtrA family protein [Paenibacillus swuensis]ANE45512.1 hypothetical protein SY83_03370 [Paenibacillus swuensis]